MKQVTLNIPEGKFTFFMELMKHLGFVCTTHISEDKAHRLREFEDSVEEVKQARYNKTKVQSANDLLNEL